MVRIVSGIVALGWGWQNWKQSENPHTKEEVLRQHVHWLQWLDRVMDRVNETQPPVTEVCHIHYFFQSYGKSKIP